MLRNLDTGFPGAGSASGLDDAATTLFDGDEGPLSPAGAALGTGETDRPAARGPVAPLDTVTGLTEVTDVAETGAADPGLVTTVGPTPIDDPWRAAGVALDSPTLSQYRLLEVVARGGPVDAYLAEHVFLDRRVLVKLVADGSREGGRAFLAEATALWQLAHPSFPAVLEYGTDVGGRPFVIMEYSAGGSLSQRLVDGPLPAALALDLAEQTLAAMAVAHGRGVAHGALSTDAIYLCGESALPLGVRVKIADFAAGVPTAAPDSTRVEVERAIRAARPEDDRVAVAGVVERLLAAIEPCAVPPHLVAALYDVAARVRADRLGLADAARELRRIALDVALVAQATRTSRLEPARGGLARVLDAIGRRPGPALVVGGIALAALVAALV